HRLSPDGRTVAVWPPPEYARTDQPLELWDLDTGLMRFAQPVPPAADVRFLPDGGLVAVPHLGPTVTGLGPDGTVRWTFRLPGRTDRTRYQVLVELTAAGRRAGVVEAGAKTAHALDGGT